MSRFDQMSDLAPKSLLHRGGRIVKWKGGTASMVPHVAELRLTVSAAAVGAALMFGVGIGGTAPAMAGTCVEPVPGSGVFECSGPAGADVPQILGGIPVTVTTEAGFGITTAAGSALDINGVDGASFDDAQASAITGQTSGINIDNMNSGSLFLTSNGTVTGEGARGIYANNGVGTNDLTITSNMVAGGNTGITAVNNGTGTLTVTSNGTATGTDTSGIAAINNGAGLTITAVDTNGGYYGIFASNGGDGALTITSTGATTGSSREGITAFNSVNSTYLSITAADVTGGEYGIRAQNFGNAGLTISTTGDVTGEGVDGVFAYNSDLGTAMEINQAEGTTITGAVDGIYAENFGGSMTINALGTVEGIADHGIEARNRAGTTHLTITSNVATGEDRGIYAYNNGSYALTVTSTGNATGTRYVGIVARNDGTDLTVTAVDTSGSVAGIRTFNDGSGSVTVTSTGTATGTGPLGLGISATNSANGTYLIIDAVNTSGTYFGIVAENDGEGALTVTSTGTANGTETDGISAVNSNNGTYLTVSAADTSGGRNGIAASNEGEGVLTITSTGTATGTASDGIFAVNATNGTGLSVSAVNTSGGNNGIFAFNDGEGALTIASTGTAAGGAGAGISARNAATGTSLSITANDVTGETNGISAQNSGTAGLTISTTGDITGLNQAGIFAYNSANDISASMETYHAEGTTITGATDGIYVDNQGGSLTIDALGTVIGEAGDGIDARNIGVLATDLTITSNVASGTENGIRASNTGTDALMITSTGTATGTNYNGIDAYNIGTNLAVNAVDTSGGRSGIDARNSGTGALMITSTGTATGADFNGITAINSVGTSYLTVNAVDTIGDDIGINALNNGTGALTITSTGIATGTRYNGIGAFNSLNGSDLTVTAADTTGGDNGIYAFNQGMNALLITSTGTANGQNGRGISARNSDGTDLTIVAVDSTGNRTAIYAGNEGTGALSITSTGSATGTSESGIYARNINLNGTVLTIIAADSSGYESGIFARNYGTEALSITATGMATGTNDNGIDAINNNGTDLTINAADTSGGDNGIFARNLGTGALRITATGTATGTTDDGINARNFNGTDLTIVAVDSIGDDNGIFARNYGTEALSITSTGTVTGENGSGIEATNLNGTNLIIAAFNTNGDDDGIYAFNEGTEALSITSTGAAIGTNDDGIDARNSITGTDLTIAAVDSNGGDDGILANNAGTGALSITSTGSVTGETGYGIFATNLNGTDLTISAVDSTGNRTAIYAGNEGTGALSITSTGSATGTSESGIYARNINLNGTVLTIIAADSSGYESGIFARNYGTEALSITATGMATGTNDNGIDAINNNGTDLTINAADTSGGDNGIFARNFGTGALRITATGAATGTTDDGINARNSSTGTDLTIVAVDSIGDNNGIFALNEGMDALSITSTGAAIGTDFYGVYALNSAAGTSLSITANDVTGGVSGIHALNYGNAGLTISTTGDVTGQSAAGIFAYNSANDVSASTTTNHAEGTTITGATDGIYIENLGGSLTIEALGTVIGLTDDGIDARNRPGTTDLTITSNFATGATNGIDAFSQGTGALTITSTGTATGTGFFGIFAQNTLDGTDLTVTSVDAIGGNEAILAINQGEGALTIASAGAASSTGSDAIDARNYGTDLTVTAFDTNGGERGILANNQGSGALTITSNGTANGGTFDGINAYNSAAGTLLSVTAHDVSGGADGIDVRQEGTGAASITTSGTVAGSTGNAITVQTTGTAITVNNSGTLESGAGFALEAIGGVTQLTNSGTVNGRVQLSAFDDVIVNNGLFNATLDSDFGAGNDLFTNEGTVAVGGGIAFTGLEQFVNNGLIDMANGAVGGGLTLPGDYVGGDGSFAFDVTFDGLGSADTLIIAGAATGNTALVIDDISTSPNFGNMVLVVDADAGAIEDAFAIAEESATIGFFSYALSFDAADNDFFLTNTIGTPAFQTLKFVEGAQSLWYRSADAWAAHMASRRTAPESPLWMQVHGSLTQQDDSFEFTSAGFTQSISLDYNQDYFGFQTGYDFVPAFGEEDIVLGLTGGYLNSNLGFDGTADNVRYDAFNIGAYAGINKDRFFANALVKYDFIAADVRARTAGYTANLDGAAYGVRIEAGYGWGEDDFFIQPLASIEYQQASLDDFSALGADIDFDNFDGLRGMVGVRLGGEAQISGSNTLTYYLGGQAVHQSQTGDGLTFTSGMSSIDIENRLSNTFGRFELGLNIASKNGVTGFFEANADISGDYTGYGGRTGLRIEF